ncbi:hypothetical protein RIF29_06720 [Crotalaria pallida]|uniref:Uncharacterized protein n=1 Tax=Crotalaria pallida TaxID=3830 RepID=A0AAN9PBP4_CROPI
MLSCKERERGEEKATVGIAATATAATATTAATNLHRTQPNILDEIVVEKILSIVVFIVGELLGFIQVPAPLSPTETATPRPGFVWIRKQRTHQRHCTKSVDTSFLHGSRRCMTATSKEGKSIILVGGVAGVGVREVVMLKPMDAGNDRYDD